MSGVMDLKLRAPKIILVSKIDFNNLIRQDWTQKRNTSSPNFGIFQQLIMKKTKISIDTGINHL